MARPKAPPTERIHFQIRTDLLRAMDELLKKRPDLGDDRSDFIRRLIRQTIDKPPPKRKR